MASSPAAGGPASSSHSSAPAALELSRHESLTWAPSSTQTSHLRHLTDYERLRTLGKGAFGTTHLVRNVVDSRRYALKCIPLGNGGGGEVEVASKGVLREVEALSALRSENVVRYFGAWVERGELGGDDNDSNVSCGEDVTDWTDVDASAANDDGACECTCNLCHGSYADWEISYEQWGLIDSVLQPLNLCTECYLKSLPDGVDGSIIDIRRKKCEPDCLYILMEYAGHTLNDEMKRLKDESGDDIGAKRWSIFAQCVQGLVHIHQGGFLHRDIKSQNIFVHDGVAKIGDLGLASSRIKPLVDSLDAASSGSDECVGTLLYAPEDGNRNEKADIYSLGIVLVELFSSFATGMERVAVLSRIREGHFPSDWAPDTPQSDLAQRMTNTDPAERPSVQHVLEFLIEQGLLANPDASVLMGIVARLQEQVRGLQQTVREKDNEIELLQKQLASKDDGDIDTHEKESEADKLRNLLTKSGVDVQEEDSDDMDRLREHLPTNGTGMHEHESEVDRLQKLLPGNSADLHAQESEVEKLRRLLPQDAIDDQRQKESEVDRMRKLLAESGISMN